MVLPLATPHHADNALLQPLDLAALPAGPLLLDLRSARRHRRAHLPGTHPLSAGRLLSGELPEGDLVLIGDDTAHSARVIEELHSQGYNRRLRHLAGGHAAWEAQGLPVESQTPGATLSWPQLPSVAGGGLLLACGALSRSLALLALGLVLVCSPWVQARARA
jgi:rhodanese-related sulfurtransferase